VQKKRPLVARGGQKTPLLSGCFWRGEKFELGENLADARDPDREAGQGAVPPELEALAQQVAHHARGRPGDRGLGGEVREAVGGNRPALERQER